MSTPARTSATRPGPSGGPLDSFFQISHRGSTLAREIRGGFVTFFAMAYIVVLNPLIIGTVPDGSGSFLADGNLATIAACTALAAGVLSIVMGVFANYPLALATGLGLNAFVAYGVASLDGMTSADAMGLVVMEGILILILVLTGFRQAVFKAVPTQLKVAISVGIGLFIALIGFVDAGVVTRVGDAANSTVYLLVSNAANADRLGLYPAVCAPEMANLSFEESSGANLTNAFFTARLDVSEYGEGAFLVSVVVVNEDKAAMNFFDARTFHFSIWADELAVAE